MADGSTALWLCACVGYSGLMLGFVLGATMAFKHEDRRHDR